VTIDQRERQRDLDRQRRHDRDVRAAIRHLETMRRLRSKPTPQATWRQIALPLALAIALFAAMRLIG
jgi:hypothetical protein